jgi:predicted CopG family antitoxin
VVHVSGRRTTIPVSEEVHLELYLLKRELGLRSYDELIRKLLDTFKALRRTSDRSMIACD